MAIEALDRRNPERRRQLEQLNEWRNAIAHHDIESGRARLVPREVTLETCRSWRGALDGLAESSDRVVAEQVEALVGSRPW